MQRKPRQSGFTLIEVMVVVVIIGILAAVIVPKIMDKPDEARLVKVKQDITEIQAALDMYRLDNYVYPTTDQGLQALVSRPGGQPEAPNWKGYIERLPKDPWGRDYVYLSPGQRGEVDVYSLGRDGRLGGEGADADIGSWDD